MITRRRLPEITWAREIASLDDEELKRRLDQLPVERQIDLFLISGWSERLRIIKNSEAAPEIVRAVPEEEVLLTIKGVGEEDALPLVALTTPSQLRFILDVELWQKDTIDEEKARNWLRYILSCGEQKVIQLFRTVDRELAALMLSKLIYLIPNEENAPPPPEGLPSIMPDEFFTILVRVPDEAANVELLLRILRGWNRDRFYDLLFDVYGRVGAETEEEAYRWRCSRLEEKGLLEFEEAVEIYGYIGETEARDLARLAGEIYYRRELPARPPVYPVLLGDPKTFLYEVLTSIDDEDLANRLRAEIAFAANRVLVADAAAIGELDAMKHALDRVFSLVNLGIIYLVGTDHEAAIRTLRTIPVKDLFQIGFSRVIDIKTLAQEMVRKWWPEWRTRGLVFLEHPQNEIVRGALMRVPQYYSLASGQDVEFRDFRTMDEVSRTRRVIQQLDTVAYVLFGRLGIPRPHDAKPALKHVFAQGIEDINLRNLMVTGFVHYGLTGEFRIDPIKRDDVKSLFETLLEATPRGKSIRAGSVEQFLEWLRGIAGLDSQNWQMAEAFVRDALKDFEEEISLIASWKDVDPRYVSSLIFSRTGS